MIDRPARNALALAIRQLACGRITNDQFEASLSASQDAAVIAVAEMAWTLYDDLSTHYLKGAYALSPQAKRSVARCILFLRSELQYPWHDEKLTARALARFFADVFTLGAYSRVLPPVPEPNDAGDVSVWPFFSRVQLRKEIVRVTCNLQQRGNPLQTA